MYYRSNSEDYNEKNNTDSYQNHDDDYEEFYKNRPYYAQQAAYSPRNYQMMSFNPMMWDVQKPKNYDQNYRNKGSDNLEQCMPMTHMPMIEDEDGDLKMLYPKIYIRIYPMVKHHCDMMTSMYGTMYCPSKDELDHISKEICEKHEKYYRDYEEDDNLADDDEYTRQRRRFNRRHGSQDLIKILLISELLGRRHNGGYWW
ncbi:hypothetical protein [Clostridium sp. CF012]|uniref:hypothetical protein n=1 Tax=Clostridium sp. CF012 TaxID=2843319 RepID=UPI001C0DE12C|nr:hypothetical protein [Clostridium sp. CF012]MBU3144405.1 hypothetical protein [Clostridium sp. CF012]